MRVSIEQHKYFSTKCKYGLAVEGNKQNLEADCKPVDIDLAGNRRLGVEWATNK